MLGYRASIFSFALKIGERATLVKSEGKRAYGSIMSLSTDELNSLYDEESVADYIPEDVVARSYENEKLCVVSYNLPLEKLEGKNKEYALSLARIAKKIGLPTEYVLEIEQWVY